MSADQSVSARIPDASYLVEPVEGLWILSIDSNVFLPQPDGATYTDSSDAGWNALVKHKPRLLDWIRDVVRRAETESKALLVFSHYPIVDYTNGTGADQEALFGRTSFIERNPVVQTSEAGLRCGLRVHFSGHLHIDAIGIHGGPKGTLVNVAVPSLAAYPPAYKVVSLMADEMVIETAHVDEVARFDELFEHYRCEGGDYGDILEARSYRDFLREHLTQLVLHRHLAEDWSDEMLPLIRVLKGGDLLILAFEPSIATAAAMERIATTRAEQGTAYREAIAFAREAGLTLPDLDGVGFDEMVLDWYRLRNAGALAFRDIAPGTLRFYSLLIRAFGARPQESSDGIQAQLAVFMRILDGYLSAPRSERLRVNMKTGSLIVHDEGGAGAVDAPERLGAMSGAV
jgi:hypothetical protein